MLSDSRWIYLYPNFQRSKLPGPRTWFKGIQNIGGRGLWCKYHEVSEMSVQISSQIWMWHCSLATHTIQFLESVMVLIHSEFVYARVAPKDNVCCGIAKESFKFDPVYAKDHEILS